MSRFLKAGFDKLVTKIAETIQEEDEDNDEEEEEEEDQRKPIIQPQISDHDDFDDFLNEIAEEDKGEKVDSEENSNMIDLQNNFQVIQRMNSIFYPTESKLDPYTIVSKIESLLREQEELNTEKENTDNLLIERRRLATIEANALNEKSKRDQLQDENNILRQNITSLQETKITYLQKKASLESATESIQKEIDSLMINQKQLQKQLLKLKNSLNEDQKHLQDVTREKESAMNEESLLQNQLENFCDQQKDAEEELNDIREQFQKLSREMDLINMNQSPESTTIEDNSLEQLQQEADNIIKTFAQEKATTQFDDTLEQQLIDLRNEYEEFMKESKPKESDADERKIISTLLSEHFQGDKNAMQKLAKEFNWTPEIISGIKEGQQGIGGWIGKGVSIFRGLRDSWTSWLISASE